MKEEMKNKSEMGQHFAERFKDFSLEPSPEVWSNVSRNIPLKNTPMISTQMWLISAAAAIVIGLAAFVLVNSREDSTAISEQSNPVEQVLHYNPVLLNQNLILFPFLPHLIPLKMMLLIQKIPLKLLFL